MSRSKHCRCQSWDAVSRCCPLSVSRRRHYAFLVDDDTFDEVLHRLSKWPAVDHGSGPENGWDREINLLAGGRGDYVRDPNGHSYELFTAVP